MEKTLIPRHITDHVMEALTLVRVVAIEGPRQCGKTTLVESIAQKRNMGFVSLDDQNAQKWATADYKGFFKEHMRAGGLVIDEIQRVPNLILTIKYIVDRNTAPGRFIITGSVDFFSGTKSPDSLAGRMMVIPLAPFSTGEIEKRPAPADLFDRLFAGKALRAGEKALTESRSQIASRIVRGGYPDYFHLPTAKRFLLLKKYATTLLRKDAGELQSLRKMKTFTSILTNVAAHAGQLLNYSRLGSAFRVSDHTISNWIFLLEQLFLVRRLESWFPRDPSRGIRKQKKIYFLDTGLLAAMHKMNEASVTQNPAVFGLFLENFVFTEMMKILSCPLESPTDIYYWRNENKEEVDFILERGRSIIAVEVKASMSVAPKDIQGLKRVQHLCGHDFKAGIVFYTGEDIQTLGDDRLFRVPISYLWH